MSSQCAQAFLDELDDDVEVTHLDVWSDDIVSFGREAARAKFGPLFGEPHTPADVRAGRACGWVLPQSHHTLGSTASFPHRRSGAAPVSNQPGGRDPSMHMAPSAGIEATRRTDQPTETARLLHELGGEPDGDRSRIGESYITLESGPQLGSPGPLNAAGFRYISVQVRNVEAAYRHVCSLQTLNRRSPCRHAHDTGYGAERALCNLARVTVGQVVGQLDQQLWGLVRCSISMARLR